MLGQPFQRGAGAGRAAGMQQQRGFGIPQPAQDFFHFQLIIDAIGHDAAPLCLDFDAAIIVPHFLGFVYP